MLTVELARTILVKVISTDKSIRLDQNDFIQLFLENGPFAHIRNHIFGISIHNYTNQIYSLTFTEETQPSTMQSFLEKLINPTEFTTSDGIPIVVTANLPPQPLQMITLYPMPFSVTPLHWPTWLEIWESWKSTILGVTSFSQASEMRTSIYISGTLKLTTSLTQFGWTIGSSP